jgi:dTDP-glucose pyrophosphorylase/CBS domain-containing protein
MKNWERVLVLKGTPLREALIRINEAATQMALVVDTNRKLLGTLSDGDVRRALINGLGIAEPVELAMNSAPRTLRAGEDRDAARSLMKRLGLHQVPLIDASGVVVGLEIVDDFFVPVVRDNWVIIMAGGLGTRLKELTRSTPKPMLRVGARPLLETLLRSYIDQGFRRFYLAVNYKAEMIESYFGTGESIGADIRYLREPKRLGTAGALSLLPERPGAPVLVANGDLLVKHDYVQMLEEHIAAGASATMAVRDYEFQIPYGVVLEEEGSIRRIDEKPVHRSLVSAGMYVLAPEVLDLVPPGEQFDMPALFDRVVANSLRTRCHRVSGYWIDVGHLSDYEKANNDYQEIFE